VLDEERAVRCIHPLADDAEQPLAAGRVRARRSQELVVLRVEGLVAEYLRGDVLHGVDFDLERGSCTAIVGESGAGKTTLARCLVGLHTRWHGSISLDGVELRSDPRQRTDEQRRRVQYVFQNPYGSLNPTLTVAENIEEPLRHFERRLSAAQRRHRALEILSTVALNEEFANRLPGALSGGERQRVAIGRALVVNPDVLVCDEITSALDVSVQAVLVEQLRELQGERDLSMVFITHNIALVRSIAQNVVVLENGVVVEDGPVDHVLDDPRHPYTQQLLRDLPRADRLVS
jgi:peptide/nickel transport system ATP-binding protein